MYCQNCGNKVETSLNYCNRCGGKISGEAEEQKSISKTLASSLGYIGAAGFAVLIGIIAILAKNSRIDPPLLMMIILAYLGALTGVCWMILRQISIMSGVKEKSKPEAEYAPPQALKSPTTNQLGEPTQPPASVVENTTRTFDKVPVERE